MEIQKVTDTAFAKYGKVMSDIPVERILKEMEHTPLPEGVIYVPSVEALEVLPDAVAVREKGFGGLPIQIGYCNGSNVKLNALEYHRSSEIDIAVTDLILLLGCQQDIKDDTYDTALVEAFLVPAGTVIEVYATTLHYAPCNVAESGFKAVVVLPKGTNTDLDPYTKATKEDEMLFARNKWLLSHPEANIEGSVAGIQGENLSVR